MAGFDWTARLKDRTIGDDLIGQSLRCVRSMEVTEDSISPDAIRAVRLDGPGYYLAHSQTLRLMRRDYVCPTLGDRSSPKEWVKNGKPDLIEKATRSKIEILSARPRQPSAPDLDERIRDDFTIHLRPA